MTAARKLAVRLAWTLLLGGGLLWWAGGTPATGRRSTPAVTASTGPAAGPGGLGIATWNIARARGPWWDHGRDSPHRVQVRLTGVSDALVAMDADVAVVQEADFDATRSARIDQPAWLAREGRWPWAATVPSWDLGYLPWPVSRPSDHIGRVRMGHAVLSRHPILHQEYIPLPQPPEHDPLTNHFWVHRAIQRVVVDVNGVHIHILNVHLESRSPANRYAQMEILADEIDALSGPVIVAGDLNTLPHDAAVRAGFEDGADFRGDRSMAWLRRRLPRFREAFDGRNHDPAALTFPTQDPARRLDFLLYSEAFGPPACATFRPFGGEVVSQPSDHFPVVCQFPP